MNILDELFNTIDSADVTTNPFETKEFQKVFHNFNDKYLQSLKQKDLDAYNKAFLNYSGVIGITRRTAFKVGFKTAIQLFMENTDQAF